MSRSNDTSIGAAVVVWGCFCIFVILAWPVNVYRLTQCDFEAPYRCEVAHTLGLLAVPAAMITVWFDTDSK
jgi:hypothetical protein